MSIVVIHFAWGRVLSFSREPLLLSSAKNTSVLDTNSIAEALIQLRHSAPCNKNNTEEVSCAKCTSAGEKRTGGNAWRSNVIYPFPQRQFQIDHALSKKVPPICSNVSMIHTALQQGQNISMTAMPSIAPKSGPQCKNEKDSPAGATLPEPTWDHQFAAIVRFKDKCGSFPASGHLHDWLQEQRRSVDSLSSERIEKLHKLGFNLTPAVGVQVWKPIRLVPMPVAPSVDPQCSRPKETKKRKYRTKQQSVPLEEMQRLMKEYGPIIVSRNYKPKDDLQTESLKRKFYRWFPDLEERFVASPDGLTYTPKAGHDEEVAYRSAMRKKSQKLLVQNRNNSRWSLFPRPR